MTPVFQKKNRHWLFRSGTIHLLLLLMIGALHVLFSQEHAQVWFAKGAHGLQPVGTMHDMRASHTATLLNDGKVLVVGGFKKIQSYRQTYFKSAELYDPATKKFGRTGSLSVARCGQTATLLPHGTVLIAGGGDDQPLASAELYDPQNGKFISSGEMSTPRQGHTATLLKNGNVLIAGGNDIGTPDAEVYNTAARRFEPAAPMHTNRSAHTATLLLDGRVLIAGGASRNGDHDRGVLSSSEIYDPATGRFTPSGDMTAVRYKHAAILLPDSTVLIVGGSNDHDWQGQYNTTEVYHPRQGTFSRTGDMEGKRFKLPMAVTLLRNNTVLVAGGGKQLEVYNLLSDAFTPVGEFDQPYFYSTATLLPDSDVLITGGYTTQPQSTDAAWVYSPGY